MSAHKAPPVLPASRATREQRARKVSPAQSAPSDQSGFPDSPDLLAQPAPKAIQDRKVSLALQAQKATRVMSAHKAPPVLPAPRATQEQRARKVSPDQSAQSGFPDSLGP